MKSRKIKIPQYLVHGKRQTYSVLVFPKKKWLWAYYDKSDERYEIDGDAAAYQQINHALAALIANSGKIAYFPIKGPGYGEFFAENYDAVFTRSELQFRRSEWISLRRQLDKAHRIKSFELYYEPQKLYDFFENLSKDKGVMNRIWAREAQNRSKMENDTVFFSLGKDICYAYHNRIMFTAQCVMSDGWGSEFSDYICELGYMITPGSKRFFRRVNEGNPVFPFDD